MGNITKAYVERFKLESPEKTIYTGCFSGIAEHYEEGMSLISIARTEPKGWKELKLNCLVPAGLQKLNGRAYDQAYMRILNQLKPSQILAMIPNNSVLICWEKPGVKCHRRIVAQWFKHHCGIEVLELGFSAKETPRYQDSANK